MDRNLGIGINNAVPWAEKIPRDMKRFRELTTGRTVIMGRKTFDSIKKPLPNRMNIVLTRDPEWHAKGVWHVHSLHEALRVAAREGSSEDVFIMGGASIYKEALPKANRMFITEVDDCFVCDAFFPEYNPLEWHRASLTVHQADERNLYKQKFLNLERKTA